MGCFFRRGISPLPSRARSGNGTILHDGEEFPILGFIPPKREGPTFPAPPRIPQVIVFACLYLYPKVGNPALDKGLAFLPEKLKHGHPIPFFHILTKNVTTYFFNRFNILPEETSVLFCWHPGCRKEHEEPSRKEKPPSPNGVRTSGKTGAPLPALPTRIKGIVPSYKQFHYPKGGKGMSVDCAKPP
jgi:hypothetical protein